MLHSVSFNYFGRPRELKLGINEISDVERELKVNFFRLLSSEQFGIDAIKVILWAGLKHGDQSLSPEKVGRWMEKTMKESELGVGILLEFEKIILEALKESEMFGKQLDLDKAKDELEQDDLDNENPTEAGAVKTKASASGSKKQNPSPTESLD